MSQSAKDILKQMTLDEKLTLLSGASLFSMDGCERLGLPAYPVSDGPHGVKLLKFGPDGVEIAGNPTCFPTASAMANSWNTENAWLMGKALGYEAQCVGTGVSLGPAVNIKRTPLCGRNFEYYSEDPYLAAAMGTEVVKGVQSQGVPACVKHFAVNNQEFKRNYVNAIVDERTLREIYLAAFEPIIKNARPQSVMCAYNRINGTYCAENAWLLTKVLRDEWGFDGTVMSDWDAVHEEVTAVKAGLDLRMPGGRKMLDTYKEALENGTFSEEALNTAAERIIRLILWIRENKKATADIDAAKEIQLTRNLACECMTLLKNEDQLLPLSPSDKIAVIGDLAVRARYQGGGSSQAPNKTEDIPLDCIRSYAHGDYAPGYDSYGADICPEMIAAAVQCASQASAAIVFMGTPYGTESEEYDRYNLRLPQNQIEVLNAVLKVQPRTVVVLCAGSAVETAWDTHVPAVLLAGLAGQGSGYAIAKTLFGEDNPSGKLAETWPQYLEQTPGWEFYPCCHDDIHYGEGVFVGYRYYDTKKITPKYAFGHGLSYTTFQYHDLTLSKTEMSDADTLTVRLKVTNNGLLAGKEIIQLYVRDVLSTVPRPYKELRGFQKIALAPEETKDIAFTLSKRDFAYYDTELSDWHVESGDFEILVGAASDDIRLKAQLFVQTTQPIPDKFKLTTRILEMAPEKRAYEYILKESEGVGVVELPGYDHPVGPMGMDSAKRNKAICIQDLLRQKGSRFTKEYVDELLEKLNQMQ